MERTLLEILIQKLSGSDIIKLYESVWYKETLGQWVMLFPPENDLLLLLLSRQVVLKKRTNDVMRGEMK